MFSASLTTCHLNHGQTRQWALDSILPAATNQGRTQDPSYRCSESSLVNAFVVLRLDYCNGIHANLSAVNLNRLQSVFQCRSCSVIFGPHILSTSLHFSETVFISWNAQSARAAVPTTCNSWLQCHHCGRHFVKINHDSRDNMGKIVECYPWSMISRSSSIFI